MTLRNRRGQGLDRGQGLNQDLGAGPTSRPTRNAAMGAALAAALGMALTGVQAFAWPALGRAATAPVLAPAPAGATLLGLSETASVSVTPDELTASLQASATAPNAALAQAAVNGAVAAALAAARAVPGVHIDTAGYSTWERPPGSPGGGTWQANQGLILRAHDAPALLHLVGRLQEKGLALGSLAWELSDKAQKAAHAQAMQDALHALRGRAVQAAKVLGLRFGSFQSVQLGTPPQVMPRPTFALAARAAAPQPHAVTEAITVSASVSAEVVLLPATGHAPQ
ncbi:MAG: SIMPL domain-containing protein [Rhodospirillales bacterium]|jgi:predicted secreted protein|nr:SIMPL domain-containing protein [Rhodospirillales bacterium]